jgi:hypothetical protein
MMAGFIWAPTMADSLPNTRFNTPRGGECLDELHGTGRRFL